MIEDLGEERMKNSPSALLLLLCGHEFGDEDAHRSSERPTCPSSKRLNQSHAEHQVQSLIWNFTPSLRSVLTRELFEVSPDVRLRMEARFQEEIAQLQVNIGLVRRDLRGLESLRGKKR
ncbi:hypothetical protein N7449_009494 [Penicillium cf. viridicatum]|uniref:Uncharacterized protein n=1 Tax=Penicillium cf. viridicatum TaxID=2972119 RepID=A0A9W9JBS2_9EURO|nr:hypothetical protein N7449_009494 [Penicillium cf. viridicatum]